MMKNVCLLGATGSIGLQTLDLIEEFSDEYKLTAISFGKNIKVAKEIIDKFHPLYVSCMDEEVSLELKKLYPYLEVGYGDKGLKEVAEFKTDNPIVINALVGSVGLYPTICAIKHHRDVYLANKETLVIGGKIVTKLAEDNKVKIIPIDSEHSAIMQLIHNHDKKDIKRLIITASGGSFRDRTRDELENVTVDDALKHPNWKMGAKITIDSATMMNKGFELIEAHYLFDMPMSKIVPILHKESIIHSMVEFNDGSIFAQMASSDMHLPIKYALMNPSHSKSLNIEPLDLFNIDSLHFSKLDSKRYPMISYAVESLEKGDIYPTILNSSNEACVKLFLEGKIKFLDIERIVKAALDNKEYEKYNQLPFTIDLIYEVDKVVRKDVLEGKFGE